MKELEIIKKDKPTQTQVITCRIPKHQWERFEIKCLEQQVTMSSIIQNAVRQYMNKN
jgi:hypothetical protein